MQSGVFVVDKPRGMTSHDVVARVRRARKTREVGHAGTLDPMATGVLVVMIGEATKLASYLTADDKEYEASIALGVETDSLDADGEVVSRVDVPPDWSERLGAALDAERSRTAQVPPSVSAIHVDGARAHELVRRGATVVLPAREVAVRALSVVGVGEASIDVRVAVSKGYYVRALARDLCSSLGTVGHLTALRRVRSGAFALDDACNLQSIADVTPIGTVEAAKRSLPWCSLSEEGASRARVGKTVPAEMRTPPRDGVEAWLDERGELVAIGESADGQGRVRRGFRP